MFSCSPGDVAFEEPDLQRGVFLHYTTLGLDGQADTDGNGAVDVEELSAFAKKNVFLHIGRKYRKEQTVEVVNYTRGSVAVVDLGRTRFPDRLPTQPPDRLSNSLWMTLKLIPAGEFLMCSPDSDPDVQDDEKPQHRVRFTKAFYLGSTEVTVGQFRRFVESAGYRTEAERDGKGGYGFGEASGQFTQDPKSTRQSPGIAQTDEHPVTIVSWNDAAAFCEKLGRQEGQTHRLPTEAKWEYACRARTTTRYASGDDPGSLAEVGNITDGTASYPDWLGAIEAWDRFVTTAPVGRFRANGFGLHDMNGNVWEWCSDWYEGRYHGQSPGAVPPGPLKAADRVSRGGSWRSDPRFARSAYRGGYSPTYRIGLLGFRVARVQSEK